MFIQNNKDVRKREGRRKKKKEGVLEEREKLILNPVGTQFMALIV